MDVKEMSVYFDLLYNNISSNQSPGLTEYEKSIFLTKAQEEFVIALYQGNASNIGFEANEEMRKSLNTLISEYNEQHLGSYNSNISEYAYHANIPEDMIFTIYESVDFSKDECCCRTYKNIPVYPVTHDEYHRIKNNPFREAGHDRVFRLDIKGAHELISKYPIERYYIRYLRKPTPIILEDIPTEYPSINRRRDKYPCLLPEQLHSTIVKLAVQNAWAAWKKQ